MRRCGRCEREYPADAKHFGKVAGPRYAGGLDSYCRKCRRDCNRLRRYGLLPEDFAAMLEAQGGTCKICRGANANGKALSVDHDHATGKVRGLLCDGCNRAIGFFREDVAALMRAIQYIGNEGEIPCP